MIIAGIDYSMSSPAIAVYDTTKPFIFENIKFFNLNKTKKYQGINGPIRIDDFLPYTSAEERFKNIATWAIRILLDEGVTEAVLEGYSMGSKGNVFDIAENTSVLKQYMFERGIKFYTPAPTSVKKNFCGSGNAKKPVMCASFAERFGKRISDIIGCPLDGSPENDLVDAVANLTMHPHFQEKA